MIDKQTLKKPRLTGEKRRGFKRQDKRPDTKMWHDCWQSQQREGK